MSRIFDMEGPLFTGLGRIADLFWLNVLFIVCSIPIFTIGASTTALYYVTLKMVKNEECYITKSFFRSFKQNFKQATGIWLIMMIVGGLLFTDYLIMNGKIADVSGIQDTVRKVILVILLAAAIVYAFTLRYVFPILARFDNTVKNTIRNALIISIRHLPLSAVLVAIPIVAAVVLYFFPGAFIFYLIIVLALIAYTSSFMFVKIFANYMPSAETETDSEGMDIVDSVIVSEENEEIGSINIADEIKDSANADVDVIISEKDEE